ncbi:MAG: 4-alpha-glucanotransferase [Beijerinckiaceae bacterium]|nr:4-alpha-glucanotransferase [Beijerinckiaceae bacterium]
MSGNEDLYRLAALAGVARRYRDAFGQDVDSSPEGLRAVLAALGYDVESDGRLAAAADYAQQRQHWLLRPTVPVEAERDIEIPLAGIQAQDAEWHLTLEDGSVREGRDATRPTAQGVSFPLAGIAPGYHRLAVTVGGRSAATTLIAAPPRCYMPEVFAKGGRGFGITAQLYGLQSPHNCGIGDFGDVGHLAESAGTTGAAFLGLSPVHALFPADRTKISPYSPSSRLFIDPIFIDPRQVPGFASSPAAIDFDESGMAAHLAALRASPFVEHDQVWAIKREILGKLWLSFRQAPDAGFQAFRAAGGEALELYATFEALSEIFHRNGLHWTGDWPEAYRDAQSEAVKTFRAGHPQAIAFHSWLQWLADAQFGAAQVRAIKSGMPIGLYRDLAVGVDAGGAETWARPDWFIPGLAIGAPPDMLGPKGQNWGLPPVNPATLEEQGLAAFRALLSANMRHTGAIRIDHAFQLQRLFVIPEGMTASHGAYLDYPFEAMLAAVRLESQRARSIVIAEDLGTAPEGFSDAIMRSDVLSYRILTFEREADGGFKPPAAYPRQAVAALTTHDLPAFAGWWKGYDADLRESLGIFTPEQSKAERESRTRERAQFAEALAREKILTRDLVPDSVPFDEALHYLAKSPAVLVAVQLEDILGDVNQANLPGPDSGHPNWRRKLTQDIDTIVAPGGPLAAAAAVMRANGRTAGAAPLSSQTPATKKPEPAPRAAPGPQTGLGAGRVIIEAVTPEIDGGRHAVKSVVGQNVDVEADIFTDGHEKIAADLLWRPAGGDDWFRVPMSFLENDRWTATFTPTENSLHSYTIEAWRDPFASLRDGIVKKRAAGQTLAIEALEAISLIAAAEPGSDRRAELDTLLADLRAADPGSDTQLDLVTAPDTKRLMERAGPRRQISRYDRELVLSVDRKAALFSSWYELFPRSITTHPDRHGTFRDVIAHLPYVRDLGFDVLYFPPINPIGAKNRKGRNNSLTPSPSDPGSVYAIGSPDGGHDAIHPELGTIEDFRALVAAARDHGLEIALDFAIQCSPDHPWIKEHPDWFDWRPDGTIQYAENPPKKYEDIVNIEFYGASLRAVWEALRDVVLFWVREGVRILRVDNPHTKPIPFWRWLIAEVNREFPDVIFLAEAFTRPPMMKQLAKVGFQQSYTYFTWRETKVDLEHYMDELAGPMASYYRPNFFVNTPDINPIYLQTSGRAGFVVRATLAATLSSNWGIYSGFEICEAKALPGREEYLDSEKYEIKVWDLDRPGHIKDHIRALNKIRRENPALQDFRNIVHINTNNDHVIAYAKLNADKTNCIFVVVNLDPHHRQDCSYEIPLWQWDLPDSGSLAAEDLLGGYQFTLHGKTHQLALDPSERSAVVWRLRPPGNWKDQT